MMAEKNCAIASSVVSVNVSSSALDGTATQTDRIPAVPNNKPTFSAIAPCSASPGSNTPTTNIFKSEKDTHSAAVASFTTVRANRAPWASATLSSLSNLNETSALSVTTASAAAARRDHILPVKKTDVVSSRSAPTSGSVNEGGINTLAATKMDTDTVVASAVGISSSFAPLSNTKLHSLCTVSKPLALTSEAHLVSSSSSATIPNVNTAIETFRAPPVKKPYQVRIGQKEPGFDFGNATNLEVPQEFDFNLNAEIIDRKQDTCFTGVSIKQPVNQDTSTSYAHTSLSSVKTNTQRIRSSAGLPFMVPTAKSSACQISASFQSQNGQSAFVPVVPSSSLTEPAKDAESSVTDSVQPNYSQIDLLTSHSLTKPGASEVKSQRSISTVQENKKIETLSINSPADFKKPNDNAYRFSVEFTCPSSFQFGKSTIPAVMAFGQPKPVTEITDDPLLLPGTSTPRGANSHQSSAAPGISELQPTSAKPGEPQIQPAASEPKESKFHSSIAWTDGSQLQQATAATAGSKSQSTPVAFGESKLHPTNGGSRESLLHPTCASLKESVNYSTAPTEGKSTFQPTIASERPSSQKETAEVEDSLSQLALASRGGSQLQATATDLEGLKVDVTAVTAGASQSQTSIPGASAATPGKLFSQQTKSMSVSPLRLSTFVPTSSNTNGVSDGVSDIVLFSEQKSSKTVTKSSRSSFGLKYSNAKQWARNKTNSPNSTYPRHHTKQASVTKQVTVAKKIRPRLVAQSAKGSSCSVTSTSSSGLQLAVDPHVAKPAVSRSSVFQPETNSSEDISKSTPLD